MTGTIKKPRKRRLASDEAHAWARNLRLGNHHAKSVLVALTLYVDGDGRSFVGIDQIADDIELSPDTVRRRLQWLEHIGAIVRFPQWIDENGKRNADGHGKRTTDEIRFLTEADPEAIEARARGESDAGSDDSGEDAGPSSQRGQNGQETASISPGSEQGPNPVSPRLALGQPSQCCEGLISEPEPEESSPTPPSEGAREADDGWKEFSTAWLEPMTRPSLARQVWEALSATERPQAVKAAKGYFSWLKAQRKPPTVVSAQTFLREFDAWPRWASYAPPENEKRPQQVFEAENSDGWKARWVIAAIAGQPPPQARGGGNDRGARFARALTPAELALAQFAVDDPESWPIVKAGSQSCGAWRHFLHIEARRIKTGERRYEYAPGKWSENWPITEEGLRVPHPFPPRKDGSLSTAPPDGSCSDDDLAEFGKTG